MSVKILAIVGFLLLATGAASADDESQWPTFGGAPEGTQYSALGQITPANVKKLKRAWVYRSGDKAWHHTTPIHANNTLYYCTPMNRVIALDPETGEELWRFDPHSDEGGYGLTKEPREVVRCRSVAYWQAQMPRPGEACDKRIYRGDVHGHLYAMDADTGAPCTDFGAANGHPGYVSHWDYEGNGLGPRHTTSGPIIVGDVVIAAVGVEDSAVDAADGFVRGFDTRTGKMLWEFSPIPSGREAETGAANVWSTLSADLARGLVFLPTTSPSSDFYGGTRTFPIPLSSAVVALNAATGEVVWSFQTVHHDIYDYDLPGHPLLATINKDGERREVAIQQTKWGAIFVLDRDTGTPLFPVEERPIPASTVPGEVASPTQPFPVLPEPFTRQTITRDDMYGMTFLGKRACRKQFDGLRYDGMFTPPSLEGTLHFPGFGGGGNWGGAAYDPKTNLLVIKANTLGTVHTLHEVSEAEAAAMLARAQNSSAGVPGEGAGDSGVGDPMPGTRYRSETRPFVSGRGLPCTKPPWGTLTAIDMDTGRIRWQVPFGKTRRFGITFPKSLNWGSAIIGGPIVTGGGLIFMGASMDKRLRALDIQTGEELWKAKLPYAGMAVPMTYMAGGKQYVVIAAGGNRRAFTKEGDAIVAFTLDD